MIPSETASSSSVSSMGVRVGQAAYSSGREMPSPSGASMRMASSSLFRA